MTDHLVMSWVLASIEPRLSRMFMYSNSAKELWQNIRNVYGQQNNYSYIYQLKQQIFLLNSSNSENSCLTIGFSTKNYPNNCTPWILDSGATDHMTENQKLLRKICPIYNDQFFTVANNEKKIE
jgi:hypothetical protein